MEGDPKLKPRFSGKKPQFQPLSQASVLPSAPWSPHSQTSLSTRQMAVSYITATTTAVATAVGMITLFSIIGRGIDLDYRDIEWFVLSYCSALTAIISHN